MAPAPQRTGRPPIDAVSLLTLYLAALFFIPSRLVFQPLGGKGTPALVVGLAALVFWASSKLAPGSSSARMMQPVKIALGIYVAACLISYALAMAHPLAGIEKRGADRAVLLTASLAGVLLFALDGIQSRKRLDTLLRRLIIFACVCAFIGLLQFAFAFDLARYMNIPGLSVSGDLSFFGSRSSFRRVAGTARHPIEFGCALAMVLPFAIHFAMVAKEKRRLWWAACGLIVLGIAMSLSRSGILGMFVVVVMLFPTWSPRVQRVALVLGAFYAVGLRLAIPGLVGSIRDLFTNAGNDSSVVARTSDYERIGGLLEGHTIFGRGLGTFLPETYFILDNQYLTTTLELGLFGLGALLLLLLVGIFCARGARRRSTDPETRSLAQAFAAAGLVPLTTFATFDAMSFPMVAGLTFLFLGCSGALWRLTREHEAPAPARVARPDEKVPVTAPQTA
jgi:O-antigen ligase